MEISLKTRLKGKGCCGEFLSQYPNYIENLQNKKPLDDDLLLYGSSTSTMWAKEDIILYCTAKAYGFKGITITHPRYTDNLERRIFEDIAGYTHKIDELIPLFLKGFLYHNSKSLANVSLKKDEIINAYGTLMDYAEINISPTLLDDIIKAIQSSGTISEYHSKMRIKLLRKTAELDNHQIDINFVYLDEALYKEFPKTIGFIENILKSLFGNIHSSNQKETKKLSCAEAIKQGYSLGGLYLYYALSEKLISTENLNLLMRNYSYGKTCKIFSLFNNVENKLILTPSFDMKYSIVGYDSSLPSHFFINFIDNWPDEYIGFINSLTNRVKKVLSSKRYGLRSDIK